MVGLFTSQLLVYKFLVNKLLLAQYFSLHKIIWT